jgi:excinuclease UvrABC helicase subunit UvrB
MSKFDDLFDDFLNNNSNEKKDYSSEFMVNFFKKLSNLNNFDKEDIMKELDSSLGKPDEFENYEVNGVYFQKQIWNTKNGQVIKTVISDVPFNEVKTKVKKTRVPLEAQLEIAVKEENYELAAKLRDRITKREAKKSKK